MKCYCYLMFPSNNGKTIEKYRPSASQKNVNVAPLKWYLKIPEISRYPRKTRDFSIKLRENVQQ